MQNCPKCKTKTMVVDMRVHSDGFPKRRRKCPSCNHRYSTVEIPWNDDPRYAEGLQWLLDGGDEDD